MFERIDQGSEDRLTFTFNGTEFAATRGMTVAAALLAQGRRWLRRTPVSGQRRGPFCMMGACYDCVVRVNGMTVQSCMTAAEDGMVVQSIPRDGGEA